MNPHYPEGFASQYMEYLAELQSRGVRLSIGSDCHSAHYDIDFEKTGRMLESAGITDDFWSLKPRIEQKGPSNNRFAGDGNNRA